MAAKIVGGHRPPLQEKPPNLDVTWAVMAGFARVPGNMK